MLDFRRLTVLHAVAQAGSMSKAAAALTYTPSAVSQQISALERQAGTPLLERGARGVRLTDAGKLLVGHAEAVLERLRLAEDELNEHLHLRAGRLRMAAFSSAGARLMPEAIAAFRRAYPEVELSLETKEPAECAQAIRSGQLDGAVVFDYDFTDVLEIGELRRTPLCTDEFFVAVSTRSPFAADSVLCAEDLSEQSWIQDSGTVCREVLIRMSSMAGFVPRVAFASEDYQAVSKLVAAEVGVALIPSLASDQVVDGVVLKPVTPSIAREVSFLASSVASPAVEAMRSILLAQQENVPAERRRSCAEA